MVSGESDESVLEIVLPDYIDAVKVMTFHKAKGLGFPVVINMLYESSRKTDPMYIAEENGQLRPIYITKDLARVSSSLERIYIREQQESTIQDLNMLYVANTRAKKELYNIIVRKPRKSDTDRSDRTYMDLFEDYEKGVKTHARKEQIPAQPITVMAPENPSMPLPGEEGGNWFVERLVDIRTGDRYHEILATITDMNDLTSLTDHVHEVCAHARGEYDERSLHAVLKDLFEDKEIVQWFVTRPGRDILKEVDLVAHDGSLFRPDRVVIDEDVVTVIDFKTGDPLTSHETQVKKYMEIMKELYADRRVQGFLIYIDPRRVKEIA